MHQRMLNTSSALIPDAANSDDELSEEPEMNNVDLDMLEANSAAVSKDKGVYFNKQFLFATCIHFFIQASSDNYLCLKTFLQHLCRHHFFIFVPSLRHLQT